MDWLDWRAPVPWFATFALLEVAHSTFHVVQFFRHRNRDQLIKAAICFLLASIFTALTWYTLDARRELDRYADRKIDRSDVTPTLLNFLTSAQERG